MRSRLYVEGRDPGRVFYAEIVRCSEAVRLCEEIAGKRLNWSYSESNRSGDHVWWISDVSKFKSHYPNWEFKYDVRDMLEQIHAKTVERF